MPKVLREVVREREVTAWRMRCEGAEQAEIAATLGVTQPAVSQILKRVATRMLAALEADVERRRLLHTARLERIYRASMQAWESSKQPKQKSRSQKTTMAIPPEDLASMPDGKALIGRTASLAIPVREITTKEASKSDGDPAYLALAIHADAELRKLHGVNAPKQIDLLDTRRPLEKLSDEELAQRAREAAALLAAEGPRE